MPLLLLYAETPVIAALAAAATAAATANQVMRPPQYFLKIG